MEATAVPEKPVRTFRPHRLPLLDADVHVVMPPTVDRGFVSIGVGWLSLDAVLELYARGVARWWSAAIGVADEPPGDELGRGDVLDGQPDRLEDGDRIGWPSVRPVRGDAPDLHQALARD